MHKTVLLNEGVENLNLKSGAILVDGTFGGGGHTLEILRQHPEVKIIAIDQDETTLRACKSDLLQSRQVGLASLANQISFYCDNFRNLDEILKKEGVKEIDGIILDLGFNSDQLASGRGFSFLKDEPLLMTFKENPQPEDLTAYDILNNWSEESLADVIYGYGEESFAKKIAANIVKARKEGDIKTTFDLVKIIQKSVPVKFQKRKIHVATKTFQALRIAVNDELGALKEVLEKGFIFLKSGGRMSIISFHSLEDRIVKNFYKETVKAGEATLFNKKIIIPSEKELKENPRSRSAKLRVLEKL